MEMKMIKNINIIGHKTIVFDSNKHKSILDAANEGGTVIDSMCRDGFCNQCRCALVTGKVEYFQDIILDDDRYILPCSCVPAEDCSISPGR
jgi:ferredoxin